MDIVDRLREYCVCDDGYPEQCAECAGAEEITDLRAKLAALTAEFEEVPDAIRKLIDPLMTFEFPEDIMEEGGGQIIHHNEAVEKLRAAIDEGRE